MPGTAVAYVVAISAMSFAALSARTLIYFVTHLDPPAPEMSSPPAIQVREPVAV